MNNAKFIVVEGLNGSGKTSVMSIIADVLYQHKIYKVIFTREPGGTPLGEVLRNFIKKGIKDEIINDYTELLMLYASRIQLVEGVIKPALNSGTWVVSDRYDFSSLAYQGAGKGIDIKLLKMFSSIFLKNFSAHLTLYLDVSPKISISRTKSKGKLDRFEIKSLDFLKRVHNFYKKLIFNKNKTIVIDANQSLDLVNKDIRKKLTLWLDSQISKNEMVSLV